MLESLHTCIKVQELEENFIEKSKNVGLQKARKGQEGMSCGEVRICCVWFPRTHKGIAPCISIPTSGIMRYSL